MKYLILALFLVSCKTPQCKQYGEIVSVGGCDKHGYCGVLLSNGNKTSRIRPVVGEKVCTEWKYE